MRYWQIDTARGIAVILMITYHALVDLELYYNFQFDVFNFPTLILARISGFIFTFLLGVSAQLQYQKQNSPKPIIKRALILLFWSAVISTLTFILFPDTFIYFGILHLLGFSLLAITPLLKIKSDKILSVLGLVIIISGFLINLPTRPTLDFYSPIPWFGFSIFGMLLARNLSQKHTTTSSSKLILTISSIGQKSLLIYLIHQPILLSIFFTIDYLYIFLLK